MMQHKFNIASRLEDLACLVGVGDNRFKHCFLIGNLWMYKKL
jgi:hypothetical protein